MQAPLGAVITCRRDPRHCAAVRQKMYLGL
jgi:hypothetical protein